MKLLPSKKTYTFILFSILFVLFFNTGTQDALAQVKQNLSPKIPIVEVINGYKTLTEGGIPYLGDGFSGIVVGIFTWGVSLTSILAIIMLVFGGIQYMGSDSFFTKGEGKKRIMAALGGLLIALSSVLILTTILGGNRSFDVNLDLDGPGNVGEKK